MNDDERSALASLYTKWEKSSLLDAMTHHSGEYDPQALELIAQELARRGETAQPLGSLNPTTTHAHPLPGQFRPQGEGHNRPYIQYVGAWGLNILLSCALGILLALTMNGVSGAHNPGEGVATAIIFIVVGLLSSFLTFWLSVKWMIVDRLSDQRPRKDREDEAEPASAPYSEPAARSPQRCVASLESNMNTPGLGRSIFGQVGLVIGLPGLVYKLFALTFTRGCFGKEMLALPVGFCLSLAGYALIRQDRYLQYLALGLSVAMAGWAGLMESPRFDDTFFNLLIPAAYSVACAIIGRDRKAPQRTSAGAVASRAAPEE